VLEPRKIIVGHITSFDVTNPANFPSEIDGALQSRQPCRSSNATLSCSPHPIQFQAATTCGSQSAVFASPCFPCLIDILDLDSLSFHSRPISIDFGHSPARLKILRTDDPDKMVVCTLSPLCSFAIISLKS
jgi:hypothetical protein